MTHDVLNQTTLFKEPVEEQPTNIFRLTIVDGTSKPQVFDLSDFDKTEISFGREAGNDIRLHSRYVSRFHGKIRLTNGQYIIEDLNSSNGLIFNGQSIRSRVVENGCSFRIDDGVETTTDGVLMVFSGRDDGAHWRTFSLLNQIETTIGRSEDCDIVLEHVSVSNIHAKIIAKGNRYYIDDNDSTNGVLVNGKKIVGRVRLSEKDVILITNSKLLFSNEEISYCSFKKGIKLEAQGIIKIVKKFGKKPRTISDHVTVTINPCELVAIIGGSGTGKSTLMNCMSGYDIPTRGVVDVNGISLYENYDALKHMIGYVPQQDIVFDELTVVETLNFAAKLRLPKDINSKERRKIVESAIADVELIDHREKLIKRLSGGQKKRVSIAIELLSEPNLFFLDEPASGLDPGTERNLMLKLKVMANSKFKTVILVTHSTLNLHLCDKIIFMGKNGKLCFYGSYEEALNFFGVEDMVDVYNLVTENPEFYQVQYAGRQQNNIKIGNQSETNILKQRRRKDLLHQFFALCSRNLVTLVKDKKRLLMMLIFPPVLALLASVVADGEEFIQYEMTKSLLFILSCSAFFLGVSSSILEICKERTILKREYMAGLRLDSYILSKIILMTVVCVIQSLLLITVFILLVGQPGEGVMFTPYLELFLTTFFTAIAASSMGLLVSSFFKNPDRAMAIVPFLLLPQLLFSGLIFELEGAIEKISWLAVCRFSMQAYGTTANLNILVSRLEQQGMHLEREINSFFTFSRANFVSSLFILGIFVVVCSLVAGLVLRGIKTEKT